MKALHNSSGSLKAPRHPKSPLSLFVNSSATLSSLSMPTSSLGWDGTILLDLSCNLSCYYKPVVSIEELSTPVDPAVLDHPPVTINKHMVNLLCHTHRQRWNTKSSDEPVGAETMNQPH